MLSGQKVLTHDCAMNQLVPISSSASPALVAAAGERASMRFLEFFVANIRNPQTRRAYYRAAQEFLAWCGRIGLSSIAAVEPVHVATWIEAGTRELSAPSVSNGSPRCGICSTGWSTARSCRSTQRTPCAGLGTAVEDVYTQNRRLWVRLPEKGGKRHAMPCHHNLEEYLTAYLDGAGLWDDPKGRLFRTIGRGTNKLTGTVLPQVNADAMIGRRDAAAGIETKLGNHSFRATGITAFLKSGGTLEKAAAMANHASTRTTQLYDRRCSMRSRGLSLTASVCYSAQRSRGHGARPAPAGAPKTIVGAVAAEQFGLP
jgi:hypothetical protein